MMQKNISSARALIGFLVAPGVPALVWLLLNLNAPHGEGVLIFFLLAPFAYCAAVVLGIPAYIVLGRRSVQGLLAYVVFGAIIGALFAVAIQAIEIISNLSSAPEHAMALYRPVSCRANCRCGRHTVAAKCFLHRRQ